MMESLVLSYLANALWQLPLLYVAGWLASHALRSLGPAVEHRVWVNVLLLQVFLPAASIAPWHSLYRLLTFSSHSLNGQPQVAVIMGPGVAIGNPQIPAWCLAAFSIAYAAVTAWFTARFIWRLYRIRRLSLNATAAALPEDAAEFWVHCAEAFGVKSASFGTSPEIHGPITIGIRHKRVLLPYEMLTTLPGAELRTAISHEFAHMSRHDFLKNLLYELLSLPIRFHPMLSLTCERLMETREMACDQMAAGLNDHHQYARSLLRLASLLVDKVPARTPHAIGIFDATTFERRVMRLTKKTPPTSTLRRLAAATGCVVIGVGICATTLALGVRINAQAISDTQNPSQPDNQIAVTPGIAVKQLVHKIPPVYPPDAKKARIQGKVQLEAVISKAGDVEQLTVISGPAQLQQSALDAVHQWTYKPFLLNGEPVEVKTTINVIYALCDPSDPNSCSFMPPPPPK